MISGLPVFFQPKSQNYFLVLQDGQGFSCVVCDVGFGLGESVVIFHDFWLKRQGVTHHGCFAGLPHKHDDRMSCVVACVVRSIPAGSSLAVLGSFQMVRSKDAVSVFELSFVSDGAVVADNTRVFRNPFRNVLVAEKPKLLIDEIPKLPKEAAGVEADLFFEGVKSLKAVEKGEFEGLIFRRHDTKLMLERVGRDV